MKAYKGFDKDLKCRGYQYEAGKTYVEDKVVLCSRGFHACENPMDVFGYYPPADSRYCEVDLEDVSEETDADSKRVGKKIHIGAEIGLAGIIEAGVQFVLDRVDWKRAKECNTGDRSTAANTGDQSVAANAGHRGVAANTGRWSAAANTGDQSVATNTGYWSVAANTGCRSVATNTGDLSVAANTGGRSVARVEGAGSIALNAGDNGMAAGMLGCGLVLAERGEDGKILALKAVLVDGETIKPGVCYTLRKGEIGEAK